MNGTCKNPAKQREGAVLGPILDTDKEAAGRASLKLTDGDVSYVQPLYSLQLTIKRITFYTFAFIFQTSTGSLNSMRLQLLKENYVKHISIRALDVIFTDFCNMILAGEVPLEVPNLCEGVMHSNSNPDDGVRPIAFCLMLRHLVSKGTTS